MKKVAGIVLLILGALSAAAGAMALFRVFRGRPNVPSDISIIGGADGPTAVFLAGKLGLPVYVSIIAGAVLIFIGILILVYKKGGEQ